MSRFKVCFFIGEREHAQRTWFGVPRKDDEVMLRVEGVMRPHRVLRVVWGNDGDEFHAHDHQWQRVNVEVEEVA